MSMTTAMVYSMIFSLSVLCVYTDGGTFKITSAYGVTLS